MVHKRLLLLSNSTNPGEPYLGYPRQAIRQFLGEGISSILFIPFAAVRFSYDRYAEFVGDAFGDMGYGVDAIHSAPNPKEAVQQAEAIVIGGGNTFHLLHHMYEADIIESIRARVFNGTPYIGWSAGSNVACPTIRTTNDMPIVEPPSLNALHFVSFQINPHYIDAHPPGHAGETRDQRIEEFIEVNQEMAVVGLHEGTILQVEDSNVRLIGDTPARIFRYGQAPVDTTSQKELSMLME